jgi:DNA-binding PadR family transcriptional regulator
MAVLAGGELHGYRVVERAAASPVLRGVRPDPTGVYRTLRAMEKRGLVSASWSMPKTGPARRSYRLTSAGRDCLRAWAATLAGYHKAIGGLLATIRSAAKGRRGA